MAAYMKTRQPFYGVQKPQRTLVARELRRRFPPGDQAGYGRNVLALWSLPHREEQYLALDYATGFRPFLAPPSLPLYERLIREGGWWDFVDTVAGKLVSPTLLRYRTETDPTIERWIRDDEMWIRRAALLSQLGHKRETDEPKLFERCLLLADERPFFIRKAIGWALRDYSAARPEAVREFLIRSGSSLSPLSYREAARRLDRLKMAPPRP